MRHGGARRRQQRPQRVQVGDDQRADGAAVAVGRRRGRPVSRRAAARDPTKWALAALEALGTGERRFADLHRPLDGISYTVLTRTLRALEAEGVVARFDHGSAASRVDYAFTPAGRDLLTTVHGLCAWSRTHLDDLLAP